MVLAARKQPTPSTTHCGPGTLDAHCQAISAQHGQVRKRFAVFLLFPGKAPVTEDPSTARNGRTVTLLTFLDHSYRATLIAMMI